jgi:hypothetical protein
MEGIMKFMNRSFRVKTHLAVIAALLLTVILIVIACGGAGGGGTTAGGGVGGTGSSTGTVTAFGSIWVNGIEYDTTSAEITVNGDNNATQDDLKIGMKVTVKTVNNITSSIDYESEVDGAASNKNTDAFGVRSFDVLGQKVIVNTETKFCLENQQDNCTFSFADLNNGDFVEVSGYFDSDKNIIATLVKKEIQDPGEYQIKGFVSGLDTGDKTFSINGLNVDYRDFFDKKGNPPGIAEGVLVKVIGTLNGNTLTADEKDGVEVEDTQASPGKELSLEGIVTEPTIPNGFQMEFKVNGQPVLTNDQTQFKGGDPEGDPTLIVENVKIEVEGTVNSGGKLVATEVNIEDTNIED